MSIKIQLQELQRDVQVKLTQDRLSCKSVWVDFVSSNFELIVERNMRLL